MLRLLLLLVLLLLLLRMLPIMGPIGGTKGHRGPMGGPAYAVLCSIPLGLVRGNLGVDAWREHGQQVDGTVRAQNICKMLQHIYLIVQNTRTLLYNSKLEIYRCMDIVQCGRPRRIRGPAAKFALVEMRCGAKDCNPRLRNNCAIFH